MDSSEQPQWWFNAFNNSFSYQLAIDYADSFVVCLMFCLNKFQNEHIHKSPDMFCGLWNLSQLSSESVYRWVDDHIFAGRRIVPLSLSIFEAEGEMRGPKASFAFDL